jgi:hypothetical protein
MREACTLVELLLGRFREIFARTDSAHVNNKQARKIVFTLQWPVEWKWLGRNFEVVVVE